MTEQGCDGNCEECEHGEFEDGLFMALKAAVDGAVELAVKEGGAQEPGAALLNAARSAAVLLAAHLCDAAGMPLSNAVADFIEAFEAVKGMPLEGPEEGLPGDAAN